MSERVIRITNGPMKQNCYIVHEDGIALIIDPGSEADRIIDEMKAVIDDWVKYAQRANVDIALQQHIQMHLRASTFS